MEKNLKKYITESLCYYLKLTQHCESTEKIFLKKAINSEESFLAIYDQRNKILYSIQMVLKQIQIWLRTKRQFLPPTNYFAGFSN